MATDYSGASNDPRRRDPAGDTYADDRATVPVDRSASLHDDVLSREHERFGGFRFGAVIGVRVARGIRAARVVRCAGVVGGHAEKLGDGVDSLSPVANGPSAA
jgi:hypothetical protein